MKYKKLAKYFILITFYTNIHLLYAQELNVGIVYEPAIIKAEINYEHKNYSSIMSFGVFGNYATSKELSLELKTGFLYSENIYGGLEIGLSCKYFPFENNIYILAGLLTNFQVYKPTERGRFDKRHYMVSAGIGSYLNDDFFVQIIYQLPIVNKVIDQTIIWNPYDFSLNEYIDDKLISIIKFGIGYKIDL